MAAGLTVLAAVSIVIFIRNYEKKSVIVEKTVLIALLSAISAVGRILFAAVPNVQPSSFIIIMSGVCFGPEIGMMTGLITAVASNLALGQGPWTLWQMLGWGLMGLIAGLLGKPLVRYKGLRIAYGFLWGFLFGWIMNLWFIAGHASGLDFTYFVSACVLSFYFDLAHALANALLLTFAGDMVIRRFYRIGKKYGIINT